MEGEIDTKINLSAWGRLDRRAVRAPWHQTIFYPRLLPEFPNEPYAGDGERQDNYQTDQGRRPPLVSPVTVVLRSMIHQFPKKRRLGWM